MNPLLLYIPTLVVIIGIILPMIVTHYSNIKLHHIQIHAIHTLSFQDQMITMMILKNQVKVSSSLLIFVIVWISVYISLYKCK